MRSELVDMVERVAAADVAVFDRVAVEALAADLSRIAAWVEARRVAVARRLAELTSVVEPVLARAQRTSGRDAQRLVRRARTLGAVPGFEEALAAGLLTPAHAEVLACGVARLPEADRPKLAAEAQRLVASAMAQTPEQFARTVNTAVRRVSSESAMDRLARQRTATTLRHWVDPVTGMLHIRAEFDPVRGLELVGRIERAVESLFHDAVPDGCPRDDRKHGHLQALALLALAEGKGRSGRPWVAVVADRRTVDEGDHEGTIVDTGSEAEVPSEIVRQWARDGRRVDVTTVNGIVRTVHGSSRLDAGRAQRLATWNQRVALLVMYPTCAVPGCPVPARHCVPHHIVWWRHGGCTDLSNLIPVCNRHHHAIHDLGWTVHLDPVTRVVTVTEPDGSVMTTGPPGVSRW